MTVTPSISGASPAISRYCCACPGASSSVPDGNGGCVGPRPRVSASPAFSASVRAGSRTPASVWNASRYERVGSLVGRRYPDEEHGRQSPVVRADDAGQADLIGQRLNQRVGVNAVDHVELAWIDRREIGVGDGGVPGRGEGLRALRHLALGMLTVGTVEAAVDVGVVDVAPVVGAAPAVVGVVGVVGGVVAGLVVAAVVAVVVTVVGGAVVVVVESVVRSCPRAMPASTADSACRSSLDGTVVAVSVVDVSCESSSPACATR